MIINDLLMQNNISDSQTDELNDIMKNRDIIEVLNDVILENHHYDKREIKTLWNQSEHLWRNRYSVDDQVAQPEIGWGTIKVMFNL